jgi:D-alanyl-D-alanine carboxypeptidase/D-alanyl-D-alanine-endopeptidase (penicillin-binding protein 4)
MALLAFFLLTPLVAPLLAEPPAEAWPDAQVSALVTRLASDKTFDGLELGVSVRCLDATVPISSRGDTLMTPASGAKLLSTAAALSILPLDHRFATSVRANVRNGVATDLTLVGGGDPALEPADLDKLAGLVAEAGVKRIEGPIALDLGIFAPPSTPPSFELKQTDAAYRPEVPPLGVASGAVTVTVKPGKKVGDPVLVTTTPSASGIVIDNAAKTTAGKALDKLVIEARPADGRTRILVSGSLGDKAPPQGVKKRLADPARVALELFAAALNRRGLRTGPLELRADLRTAPELVRLESRPLADLVAIINKTSNNFMAEMLFKQLAAYKRDRPATWALAAEVATAALTALGLAPDAFQIVNGSGLYQGTRVTPDAMTHLLSLMATASPIHDAFRKSLAVSGVSGTLKNRLKKLKGRVAGKTGTLDDAISLSGYLDVKPCRFAFSVIANGAIGERAPKVVSRFDRFIMDLANLGPK